MKTWKHISSSVLFVAKESIDASPLPNPNIGIIAKRSGRKRQGDIRLIRLEHCCWEGQLCHITLWSPGEEHKSGKARMILMLLECDKFFSSKQMNTCTKKYGKRDGPLFLPSRPSRRGAHNWFRGHIWLVVIRAFVASQANYVGFMIGGVKS